MATQTTDHRRNEPRFPSSQASSNEIVTTTPKGRNHDNKEQHTLHTPICSIPSHQQIDEELERRENEISTVRDMILSLRDEQKDERDINLLCALIEKRKLLKAHADELQDLCSELRWYAIGTEATFRLSDIATIRLLKIQQDTGNSTAALCAFGAALSMSILFGGTRGSMWWFYGAWWCFTFGVVMLGALQVLSAGTSANSSDATPGNWRVRMGALVVILMSYTGVALGLGCFAIAVINYDVSGETEGGDPHIDGGPSSAKDGHHIPTKWSKLGYAFISFFFCLFVGAFFYRIAPRLQLRNSHRGVNHYFVRNDQNKTGRFEAMLSGTEDA